MIRLRALFLCLCIFFWSSGALAFVVSKTSTGAIMRHKQPSVTLYVNTTGGPTGSLEAITAGMQTWNSVSTTSFRYVYAGTTTATNCGDNDGVNNICFNLDNNRGALAVNSVWYGPLTGEIFDDDINFNTKYLYSTDLTSSSYDLQDIATHELGHCLSLKDLYDPAVDSEKTMYGYASKMETKKRTLDQDDMDGITSLYPLPVITGNGTAGAITIKSSDTLDIDVSLNPGSIEGVMADWWIYAFTPFGTYYYVYPNQWLWAEQAFDVRSAYQGALFNLQPTRLLSASGLPKGYYYIYFGVDATARGSFDSSTLMYNTLIVYVSD
ncbi:matrilysin (metalloproteinase) [Candidatus Magnetobacterium bavaricum]|uniref:Matrilysin (Metalloproteinase) n=1 Tax=Candidatus Magnetobacterium bavaricum TaxID=29290 RepID=A0A0F3H2M2_9BACT|nr:matrilysin (metalloproteinase) [Candidatus Magnetobacterium bavaricum]